MEHFTTGTGQYIRHHEKERCSGRCPLHAPTDHAMVTWPMHWREDRQMMMRRCRHGMDHPDPDDRKLRVSAGYGIHACCGCCDHPFGVPIETLEGL
jgi:hypothetical protein